MGYIEKTLEKKHFAPEKMLGDDPFLLAETLKKLLVLGARVHLLEVEKSGGNDLEFVCKKYAFWKNSN